MAELTSAQKAWISLLSYAVNGTEPDKELLRQTPTQELYRLADVHCMRAITAFALEKLGITVRSFEQAKTKALRKLALFEIERGIICRELNAAGVRHCPLKGAILKDWIFYGKKYHDARY